MGLDIPVRMGYSSMANCQDRGDDVLACFYAGSGVCDVNSNCQCFDGFTGGVCDCPTSNSTCMNPGSTGEAELCSGEGQCICGLCICNNYSVNFGAFCEECLVSAVCPLKCGMWKKRVVYKPGKEGLSLH